MKMKNLSFGIAVSMCSFWVACRAFGSESLPTVQEVAEVWDAEYDRPFRRWDAFVALLKRVGACRVSTNTCPDLVAVEEAMISKILSMPQGTVWDEKNYRQMWPKERAELSGVKMYLYELVNWQEQKRDTNQLMRIADKLGAYQPLPLVPEDALIMAWQIDHYIEHGTNTMHRQYQIDHDSTYWNPWLGPTASQVGKIMDYRRSYNSKIAEMRERIFWSFHNVIMEEGYWPSGHSPHPMEENKAVWAEFSRRAKMTEKERAYAERRVHAGEQATTRGVGQ